MAYATQSQMIVRYDARRLSQLVRDDNTAATAQQLLVDPVLAAALDDASSLVDIACRTGERYTVDDLSKIAATPPANGPLIRLVCDLAYGLLWSRRGYGQGRIEEEAPRYKWATEVLEQLRLGHLVFDNPNQTTSIRPVVDTIGTSPNQTLLSRWTRIFGLRPEDFLPNYPQDPNAFGG